MRPSEINDTNTNVFNKETIRRPDLFRHLHERLEEQLDLPSGQDEHGTLGSVRYLHVRRQ